MRELTRHACRGDCSDGQPQGFSAADLVAMGASSSTSEGPCTAALLSSASPSYEEPARTSTVLPSPSTASNRASDKAAFSVPTDSASRGSYRTTVVVAPIVS